MCSENKRGKVVQEEGFFFAATAKLLVYPGGGLCDGERDQTKDQTLVAYINHNPATAGTGELRADSGLRGMLRGGIVRSCSTTMKRVGEKNTRRIRKSETNDHY